LFAIAGVFILSFLYELKFKQEANYPNRLNTMFGFGLAIVVLGTIVGLSALGLAGGLGVLAVGLAALIGGFWFFLPEPEQTSAKRR
jgi:hypothetical protein